MDIIKDAFMVIGLLFVFLSPITFATKKDQKEKIAKDIIYAIWLLIGFGAGSYLISILFSGIFYGTDWFQKRAHFPSYTFLIVLILIPSGLGLVNKFKK